MADELSSSLIQRPYYTDPLSAAWMAKHFGMKLQFLERYGDDCWMQPISLDNILGTMVNYGMDEYSLKQVFIHPDSLHLLEPQVGDVVIDGRTTGVEVAGRIHHICETTVALAVPERKNGKDFYYSNPANCRITERKGIPFMWPEREKP